MGASPNSSATADCPTESGGGKNTTGSEMLRKAEKKKKEVKLEKRRQPNLTWE